MPKLAEEDLDRIVAVLHALPPPSWAFVWQRGDTDFVRDLFGGSRDLYAMFTENLVSVEEASCVVIARTQTHIQEAFPGAEWEPELERWDAMAAEVAEIFERARRGEGSRAPRPR